jgi:pantothenate synthetase
MEVPIAIGRKNGNTPNIPAFQHSMAALNKWVEHKINENPFLRLEYFEIVNAETLAPVQDWNETNVSEQSPEAETLMEQQASSLRACIAVKVGSIRLIDNIPF